MVAIGSSPPRMGNPFFILTLCSFYYNEFALSFLVEKSLEDLEPTTRHLGQCAEN